jgi:regulator of replication initiation timing
VDILTAQLATIPKLESEIQRLHLAQDELNKRLGELSHERSEISRLLEAERKVHRINEESLKKEIAALKAQVQTLTDENTRLKVRLTALEKPNTNNSNSKVNEQA